LRSASRIGLWLVVAAASSFAQQPDVKEMIKQGWAALDAKEWDGAEFLFRAALKDAPEHAEAHAGLGVAWARQGSYDRALVELETASYLASKYEHLDLEIGRAYYMNRQYARALPHLEAYAKSHPDVWQTYEILGVCDFYTKAFDKCVEAFAHPSLKAHTEHAAMYAFYTGAAHVAAGRADAGIAILNEVVAKNPGTPYAESARKVIDAAAKGGATPMAQDHDVWSRARRLRDTRWWYVFGGIGTDYDTNPVSIGHEALVTGSLGNRPTWDLNLQGGVGARIVNRERTFWGVEAKHATTWHDDLASFDQNQFSGSTYVEHWVSDRIGIAAAGAVSKLWISGDETRDSWDLGPSVYVVEAFWTRTRVFYDHQNNEYFLALTDAQDVDSEIDTVGLSQEAYIPGTELRVALGYSHSFQDADGDDYDAEFDRVSVLVAHPIVWQIRGTATFSYAHGDYENDNSRDPGPDARDDDTCVYGIRLDRPITGWMSAYASATWVDGESNLGVFDYDRNIYSVGVEFRY